MSSPNGKSFLFSSMITVFVGAGRKEKIFYIHERLLTDASHYFKTALQSNFAEAQTKIFRLEVDDANAFNLFVEYLYGFLETDEDRDFSFTDCVKAFALGDKLLAPGFKRQTVLWVAEGFLPKNAPVLISMPLMLEAAKVVYYGVPKKRGGKMRRLLREYCVSRLRAHTGQTKPWTKPERSMLAKSHHYKFIVDVME